MEQVLRPGMRLMRRLGVAGKFGLIAVLILIPLCISIAGSFQESTGQIDFAQREREGLTYSQPLVHLVVELSQARSAALEGRPTTDAWTGIVREIDDANDQIGDTLGVHADWIRLRPEVQAVYEDGASRNEVTARATLTSKHLQQLIKKVADASNLILDPQLDSYYVMIMLVDRLPRLVLAASEAQALRSRTSGSDDLTLAIASNDLTDAARQLALDVTTAVSATNWPEMRQRVGVESLALSAAVAQYSTALTDTSTQASARSSALDTSTVDASAAALSNVLSYTLDQLLVQRQQRLASERTRPLLMTLIALVVAGYLLMALFRATTRDVRAVLEDISTVTNGAVQQTAALTGSDEFAQMSRAVIYARDRLTALVGALKFQATHDELTALANRQLFTEKVEDVLAAGSPGAAVVLVDLDGFKDVNDSFGHAMGDRLLRTVGARIHRNVPRRSVVARLGSDEFAILLTDARDQNAVDQTVARLEQALAESVDIDGRRMRVQAGIGVADAATGSPTAVELIRNADVALNFAKDRGKGHTARFEPSMHDRTRERTELSADLVQAIERGELRVLYQPLVDLASSTVHGVEALVRWEHPVRGTISPTVFVPLAEATGLIGPIGHWVLEQSCEQLATWQRAFPDGYPLTMDVNLSTDQLADRHLVSEVLAIVEQTGIDPTALVLEITESSLVKDIETALRRLGQLSAVGLRIALDDFGTGYSSLSYLRRLPVGILKVDKSFVMDGEAEGRALLRSIVDLGMGQGMQIVAEGVETLEQAEAVRATGCHLGQGYLWARPLPAEQVTAILARGGRLQPVPLQRTPSMDDRAGTTAGTPVRPASPTA